MVIVAGVLIAFLVREEFISWFGWSAVPLLGWVVVVLFLANGMPHLLKRWPREMAAALLLAVAASIILGTIAKPGAFYADESMGGRIGELMARWPSEWDGYGVTFIQYALAGLRAALLLVLAVAVVQPGAARKAGALTGVAVLWAAVTCVAVSKAAWVQLNEWAEDFAARRRERKAAALAATTETATAAASAEQETEIRITGGELAVEDTALEDSPLIAGANIYGSTNGHQEISESDLFEDDELEADEELASPVEAVQAGDAEVPPFVWKLPSLSLLKSASGGGVSKSEIEATGELIVDSLHQHAIEVSVDQVRIGPTVTMYGLKPGWKGSGAKPGAQRVRVDTILNREKDLALALASPNLRFEAPVPGESVVGIEVPNENPMPVTVRSVMDSEGYRAAEEKLYLPAPLGLDSGGQPAIADLTRMPHLLVAGSTGSGKSVCINALIVGLLMSRTPEQLRMVMIDPKRVELTPYAGIPHLYTEPVVEPERAIVILRSLVQEMMGRFQQLQSAGVRNIATFNEKSTTKMPYLLILVDELADLMLTGANEVERLLVRLAQLGRATGVHLVVATQRPSVDVVTGLIKANFPSRISFSVMSQVDSRTIIDSPGAEKLLGKGDMLFLPVDKAKPGRIQGAFLSDSEVEAVVKFWSEYECPELPMLEVNVEEESGASDVDLAGDSHFDNAVALAKTQRTLSTSLLQRRLRIGYPRAARLMDELEEEGVVGPGEPGKPRQVVLSQ